MRDTNEIVYSLKIEDIQTVAAEELERPLTDAELDLTIKNLPGYIDWQRAIYFAIQQAMYKLDAQASG